MHEAAGVGGAAGDDGLEGREALRREWRTEQRGRSVLATLQPPTLGVAPPMRAHVHVPAPVGPAAAAAAYLGASRYVAGARIDTTLFQPLALRPHRGKEH